MYSVNPITYYVMSCHTCILFLPYLTSLPILVLPTTLIDSMLLHGFSAFFFSISRSFYLSWLNPSDNLIRQSHLITAFSGEQLQHLVLWNWLQTVQCILVNFFFIFFRFCYSLFDFFFYFFYFLFFIYQAFIDCH